MANLIGQSLGRYHILEQLGEGGMATVYKAYDTRLERDVAVKIIRKTAFSAEILEKVLARFEREAKALAKLSHPNIVKVHDYGDHEGSPYLVLEYLPGGTLRQLLGKPIPWQEALQLLLPIARGLAYAHQRGIIHRDVKPSNILVTESGEPLLSDFGIAKLLEIEEGQTLTGSGVGIGTPEYMAPEQGIGKGVDARADIYSLGIVLYEMVTGRKPYMAETPMAVVLKQMTDPLPRPTDFNREIPPPVEKILLKALAKKPQDRYESMNNFIQAMEICLVGKQSGIKKVSFSMQAKQVDQEKTIDPMIVPPSIVSGKKTLWILATTCIVVVALVGGVLGWQRLALSSQKPTSAPTLEKANAPLLPDQTVITTEKTSLLENTRTPSPSMTNIPDGTVLFSEDFEGGLAKVSFGNIWGNWKISEDNTNKVFEIDNEKSSDYAGLGIDSMASKNYMVEYRVKMLHHTSGAPEVILNFWTNYDGSDGYYQSLTPYYNDISSGKYVNGSGWQDQVGRNYSFFLGQWYHVRVQAAGSNIKIFIEDKLIIDRTETQFSSGPINLQVGPGAHVLLDDFTVTALGP